jgi:predicted nucleic acid-binding protein
MIIVHTNVVSELMKPSPSELVIEWLRARARSELLTSSITGRRV